MNAIYIARQPIYDNKLKVIAYELLFRADQITNEANFDPANDGDNATTNVLLNAITEIGMDKLVGPHLAFVNLTYNHILQMAEKPLTELKGRLVLEVLEDIKAEDIIIKAVHSLAHKGFTIALDDFIYHESLQPLVDIAHIIKIDLMAVSNDELAEHVKKLSDGKRKLLAEKVETEEDYNRCKKLGFDYYQGYYFSRPQIIKGRRLPANKLATLELLAKLQNTESSTEKLVQIISHDVTMSVRVLRYINSAQFGFGKEIGSIKQAIMMLGRNTIRNLANLVAMSQIDDKPSELLVTSMVRAKMAENIAHIVKSDKEVCFTIGLLSVIDALMDQEMVVLTDSLPLPEIMKAALLRHEGEPGKILNCVIAYENGDWINAEYANLSSAEIRNSFLNSLEWASKSASLLH
jgi:EAL and modified HD-GYP domain-containing signal transduction protein